ncbi:MAG: hypothetical protein K0R17_722, partial [Rariglobus sp.]|nr:hypothetical protein [Rariglobus sp.]
TQNPAKAGVPIWFTELGYDSRKGEDPQAHALVKAYTMGIVQGITCINWYEGIDGDAGPLGLLRKDGTPRPSYKAMGEMIRLLGLNPSCVGWVLLNDKHYAFVLQGNGRTVLATWAATRKPDTIDFRQPVQLIDPVTGKSTRVSTHELTTAPILIDGVPESIVAQARSNKTKPLPWNGDYSDAGSVSITFGKTNVEKGLHSQSADSIAADVVAYGGNARAGTVPGGNVFMVDPNFLSYAQTPIEITIVVRRNEANDPAKLELEYESTSGYKKAPAFNVPDNHQWHKATWKLTDIQFVSTWAFNFRINTGKYVVQSVTVTKLAR